MLMQCTIQGTINIVHSYDTDDGIIFWMFVICYTGSFIIRYQILKVNKTLRVNCMIIPLTQIESLKSGNLFRIMHTENSNKFDWVIILFLFSRENG